MKTKNGGYLVSQIKYLQSRAFSRMLSKSGIEEFNGAQGRILFVLWQQDNISIAELSQKTKLSKNALTSMLDRMESKKLIKRESDEKDRRKIRILLTSGAQALEAQYKKVSEEMTEVFYSGFTDDEIDQFENQLKRIIDNLDRKEKDA
ncbi:MAG: MarR family transcriptional regulator [Clostridia bacterium]|nr:MarR family transcriptional regulator [Clostridia bacterium]